MTRVTLTTANTPGAVAIVQMHGDQVGGVLQQLTGREHWTNQHAYLVSFADIDEGLAIMLDDGLHPSPMGGGGQTAQLMPHGGPRVVQRLLEHLTEHLGCIYEPELDPQSIYPEAASPIEADMLDAVAKAVSPAAIDLLSQQPALWRGLLQQAGELDDAKRQAILTRSQTLGRLLAPPTVVVAGPANVGKSTLTNALMGKAMSIVADLPGTTRDWVGGLVELSATNDAQQAIAVHWLDTPGLRDSEDTIEQRAIELAKQQIEQADVLLAMRDSGRPWPDASTLPREPDLYVINKVDDAQTPDSDAGKSPEHPLAISASQSLNLEYLQSIIIKRLGLSGLANEPWAFSPVLVSWCEDDTAPDELAAYLGQLTRRA